MHFLQGRVHNSVSRSMTNMGLDASVKPLAVHLLWKMDVTIWRTRNQALHGATKKEREYRLKEHLEIKIHQLLQTLNDHKITHMTVPIG